MLVNPDYPRRPDVRSLSTALIITLMLLLISVSAMYMSLSGALEQTTYTTPGERNNATGMHAGMLAVGPTALVLAAIVGWRSMRPRRVAPEKPQAAAPALKIWAPAPGEQFIGFHRSNLVQIVLCILVVAVALGCALGTLWTWAAGLTDGWSAQGRMNVLLGMLLGPIMVAVVAALLGWINPWIFSSKGYAVVVGESGLFVNVPGCSVGQVSWDEIRSIGVRDVNHVRFLAVEVINPENVVARSGSRVVGMNFSAYGTPVVFQLFRVRGWRGLDPALERFAPLREDGLVFARSA